MANLAVITLSALVGGGSAQDLFVPARLLRGLAADEGQPPLSSCPSGWDQVGEINADIQGCGLEECDSRFQVPSLEACALKCEWSGLGCKAFSWAPVGGDHYHLDEKVCTMYATTAPNQVWGPHQILCQKREATLECPHGWVQVGGLNNVEGCGLESCDSRYGTQTPEECSQKCNENTACKAFSWAPIGRDHDHLEVNVCTLYDVSEPNQAWGQAQMMCKREQPDLQCPSGWKQVGGRGADIYGCGLEGCTGRFTTPTLEACSLKCAWSGLGCKAFSWAPVGGDKSEMDRKVCTLYGTDTQDHEWDTNQILCKVAR